MQGRHLTADLLGCDPSQPALTDADMLRTLCVRLAQSAGLTPVGELFHSFGADLGVAGTVLLREAHVTVRTCAQSRAVTLDLYVGDFAREPRGRIEGLFEALSAAFGPLQVRRHCLERGMVDTEATTPA